MENISGFFVVFKEVEQWQITINIARRERYKFFTTKIYSKERTVIKTTLKTFNLCSSYYGRSRYFFDGHKLPARANGTKREAIWYSELYLLEKVSKIIPFRKGIENRVHGGDELRRI